MVYTFESESEKNPGFTAEVLLQFHSLEFRSSVLVAQLVERRPG